VGDCWPEGREPLIFAVRQQEAQSQSRGQLPSMTATSTPTVEFITRNLSSIAGTLQIFGQWFGRPYDNIHTLVGAQWDSDHLLMRFNGGESLRVWQPEGLSVHGRQFVISSATRVLWQWYYYGRPQIPQNLYFEDYVVHSDHIVAKSSADWYVPNLKPDSTKPAVIIHG
jgi:hypothetical protein